MATTSQLYANDEWNPVRNDLRTKRESNINLERGPGNQLLSSGVGPGRFYAGGRPLANLDVREAVRILLQVFARGMRLQAARNSRCSCPVGSEVAHSVARVLATVRRPNGVCGFPAPRFHEGTNNETRFQPYRVGLAPHLSG